MFDTRNDAEYCLALSATLSGTTPSKGTLVDMQGFESVTFVVSTGTVTDAGTSAGFGFEVQECDTTADTSFTAVADGDLIGLESALTVTGDTQDDKLIGSIGYRGSKRYVRIVATGTTGTNAYTNVVAIKRHGSLQGKATIDAGTSAT